MVATVQELVDDMERALALAETDGAEWQEQLERYGCIQARPSPEHTALSSGFRPTHGAPPDEVRRVLEAICGTLVGEEQREQLVGHLHRRYLDAVRPKSTLGGIFANAAATSRRGSLAPGRVETLRCERCGAGRQREDDRCGFCGHSFQKARQ